MKKVKTISTNPKLDAVWDKVPRCDRYSIEGKRWVMFWWQDGHGSLMPLADYAEAIKNKAGS